jgi:hypothetical protein
MALLFEAYDFALQLILSQRLKSTCVSKNPVPVEEFVLVCHQLENLPPRRVYPRKLALPKDLDVLDEELDEALITNYFGRLSAQLYTYVNTLEC